MNKRLLRLALVAASVGTALLLAAGPALAALTSTAAGGVVTVAGNGAADTATVTCTSTSTRISGVAVVPDTPCASVTAFDIDPGPGSDVVDLTGVSSTTFPALAVSTVDTTDASVDVVTGSALRDVVAADDADSVSTGTGDDRIIGGSNVAAGDGSDILESTAGTASGEAGNDRIVNPAAAVDGGLGDDVVERDYTDAPDVGISIALSDATASITATSGSTPGTVVTSAVNVEQYALSMPDGVQNVSTVDSRLFSGRVVARLHTGVDTFFGGRAGDFVDAGPGFDVIDPGAGSDTVRANDGNDTIYVLDGQVDVVGCGDGTDTVVADRFDVLGECELVTVPPLPPTPLPETGAVVGLKKVSKGAKAPFLFVSPTAGATFQCRLDRGDYLPCSSPYKVKTKRLSVGKHKVKVRAVLAGVVDPTPAKVKFKVLEPRRR